MIVLRGPIVLLAVLLAYAAPYAIRARTLRRQGRPVARRQLACFVAALAVFAVALSPPLDALADRRLAAHMLEHVLLGDIIPILLVLACSGAMVAPLLRAPGVARLQFIAHPIPALGLWLLSLYAWHLPAAYEAALTTPAIHLVQHACFLWFGLNLWLALLGPLPKPAWFGLPARLFYVCAIWLLGSGVGASLVFSGSAFYPTYVAAGGAGALGDQSTAGALMMVEQGVVAFCVFSWLFLGLWREASERQELAELAVAHGVPVDGARVARAVAAGQSQRLRERIAASATAEPAAADVDARVEGSTSAGREVTR